jgi:hypothetical protein
MNKNKYRPVLLSTGCSKISTQEESEKLIKLPRKSKRLNILSY